MPAITGQQAKKIIKGLGFDTSKVSCTVRRGTYSLTVTIKDISIPLETIKDALSEFEKINRCEYTGEILQGGNHFVFVNYDWSMAIPESFVDLYTLCLVYQGKPQTFNDEFHFIQAMKANAPYLTMHQVSHAFYRINRNLPN